MPPAEFLPEPQIANLGIIPSSGVYSSALGGLISASQRATDRHIWFVVAPHTSGIFRVASASNAALAEGHENMILCGISRFLSSVPLAPMGAGLVSAGLLSYP